MDVVFILSINGPANVTAIESVIGMQGIVSRTWFHYTLQLGDITTSWQRAYAA